MATFYVSLDFFIDLKPLSVHSSYQFLLKSIPYDQPQWLKQDNLTILLIKRSESMIAQLQHSKYSLQDAVSDHSRQPDYAKNSHRSRYPAYYVSYATGTDLGCLLELKAAGIVGEVCSSAQYDFAGRSLKSNNQIQNLVVPDYNFSDNFTQLTIKP